MGQSVVVEGANGIHGDLDGVEAGTDILFAHGLRDPEGDEVFAP
jgi:hypothetical protein